MKTAYKILFTIGFAVAYAVAFCILSLPFALFSFFGGAYILSMFLAGVAILILFIRWITHRKFLLPLSLLLFSVAILLPAGLNIDRWYRIDRYERVVGAIDWWRYKPFEKDNLLVKVEAPEELRFTEDPVPVVRAAYALFPLATGALQALAAPEQVSPRAYHPEGSDWLFTDLNSHPTNTVAFGLEPSEEQMETAKAKGLTYEMTPFAKGAFVFFVHADNPMTNISTEQIRGIYSGRITTWRELGVDLDDKLLPFQRNKNSGSQTTLERLMGDEKIIDPIKEDRVGGMGGIINDVADYRNTRGAIGFSFRYYATTLVKNNKIKLLAIDGVEPTVGNIRNGTYPHVSTAFLITAAPREGNVAKLIEFFRTPAGRQLVDETGYVSIGDDDRPRENR